MSHTYPFKLLHVVQVGLLTNAQIEEFLPFGACGISLGLEMTVNINAVKMLNTKMLSMFEQV